MIKFKVYKEELSIDLESLDNPDVAYLWELDDSKNKKLATQAISYVFFSEELSDENPLAQIPYYDKEKECLYRAFGSKDFDIESELGPDWYEAIITAKESYSSEVPDTLKDINTFNRKMDELGLMLQRTKPKIKRNESESDGKVSFSSNTPIITKSLNSIIQIIQSKASLVAIHVQGTVPKHLRGGLSPLSKGDIKLVS